MWERELGSPFCMAEGLKRLKSLKKTEKDTLCDFTKVQLTVFTKKRTEECTGLRWPFMDGLETVKGQSTGPWKMSRTWLWPVLSCWAQKGHAAWKVCVPCGSGIWLQKAAVFSEQTCPHGLKA